MKTFFKHLVCAMLIIAGTQLSAQDHEISISGQLGWAIPGGSGVGEAPDGAFDVSGGLSYTGDVMYHLMEGKLKTGVSYTSAILANSNPLQEAYGMTVYGVKGLYYLKPEGFSPFGGLALGLATLSTPETSVNGVVVSEAISGSRIAIQPTIGLAFGGFYISANYLLPGNIKLEENDVVLQEGSIGFLSANIGYRYSFGF